MEFHQSVVAQHLLHVLLPPLALHFWSSSVASSCSLSSSLAVHWGSVCVCVGGEVGGVSGGGGASSFPLYETTPPSVYFGFLLIFLFYTCVRSSQMDYSFSMEDNYSHKWKNVF